MPLERARWKAGPFALSVDAFVFLPRPFPQSQEIALLPREGKYNRFL
jgi:hypothetical protein